MKLIDLHKQWMENGKIVDRPGTCGQGGLCNAVPLKYIEILEEFEPEKYKTYWASELPKNSLSPNVLDKYNPLRQTIVLLICAMNNEL